MKSKFLDAFMKTAKVFSELSTATRKKVGAVIVKDNRIISIGYNGMPSGWTNECEYEEVVLRSEFGKGNWLEKTGEVVTKPEVLHAESNAIAKLARSIESGDGAMMFITCAPCMNCAKMIYQSGIQKVFYGEQYRENDGLEFLHKCGVHTEQLQLQE